MSVVFRFILLFFLVCWIAGSCDMNGDPTAPETIDFVESVVLAILAGICCWMFARNKDITEGRRKLTTEGE